MSTLRTLDELVSAIPPGRRVIVAIAGAPGAGKSTIAEQLVSTLPDAALLPMDGFHLPQAELRRLGRRERMGAPDTFDVDGFVRTLAAVRGAGARPTAVRPLSVRPLSVRNDGDAVTVPGFNREKEEPIPGAITIGPSFRTIVVEGNYLLLDSGGWENAAHLCDVTFFVEVDEDIRLERLIARHERFGKSAADARAWATGPDESNARLVAPTAARADHILNFA